MIPPIGREGKPLAIGFELIRILGNIVCPELSHHLFYFVRTIIITVRKHISKLAIIRISGARLAWIGSEARAYRLVGDTYGRNLELVGRTDVDILPSSL